MMNHNNCFAGKRAYCNNSGIHGNGSSPGRLKSAVLFRAFGYISHLRKLFIAYGLFLLIPVVSSGQSSGEPLPLFRDHSLLEIKLVCNYNKLLEDTGEDRQDYPARLIYHNPEGERLNIVMELKTRGNFRRDPQNCNFPPIRLDFDGEREGTIFEGQGKVKLVTHCLDSIAVPHENVQKEYLVYRLYNMLTPLSFRARLCRINYRQSWWFSREKQYAFILEDNDDLAARFNGKELDEEDNYLPLDTLALARVAFFAYMMGNTDWSVMPLKNIEILDIPGADHIPVPYDFDLSAFVNAPYAPDALFVDHEEFTKRTYKGPKLSKSQIDTVLKLFREKREKLLQTIIAFPYLSDERKQRLVNYLNTFYEEIAENLYQEAWTKQE